jgi:hypothetical protein
MRAALQTNCGPLSRSSSTGLPFGGAVVPVVDGVGNQLDARRNSELIEDPKQIFLHGVFAEG